MATLGLCMCCHVCWALPRVPDSLSLRTVPSLQPHCLFQSPLLLSWITASPVQGVQIPPLPTASVLGSQHGDITFRPGIFGSLSSVSQSKVVCPLIAPQPWVCHHPQRDHVSLPVLPPLSVPDKALERHELMAPAFPILAQLRVRNFYFPFQQILSNWPIAPICVAKHEKPRHKEGTHITGGRGKVKGQEMSDTD